MARSISTVDSRRRLPWTIVLAATFAGSLACGVPVHAADDPSTQIREGAADDGTLPGDDFFRYANGDWLKRTEIPTGQGRWGSRAEITERVRRQVTQVLEDANAAPPGSIARKVADFRAAYIDEIAIEARGLTPLRPLLARIDRIRDKAGLTRYLGSELPADVDPLNQGIFDSSHVLGLSVEAGNHGEKNYVAYLLQGGLGLVDREAYLGTEPRHAARRAEYLAAIVAILTRLDADDAPRASSVTVRADAVMALEVALARSHATAEASANERNSDTLWTRADFAREAPGMDWRVFFAAAGLARQPAFVAWQPNAAKGVAALVSAQPLEVWKDYLRIRTVGRHAEVLPREAFIRAMTLRGVAAASETADARAARALDATQAALGEAIGRMYSERYFPPEHKDRLQAIVANVVSAFSRRVETAPWLSPATRATALAKLKGLYRGLAYPDQWQDYATLVIDPKDAVGNLRRVAQRNYRRAVARLGRPIDRTEWSINPQGPGAVLTFNENSFNFAGALLQAPKFDPSASDATNYGAIGAIAGHEISHFVDTLGAEYEVDGRLHRWWSDEDAARYRAVTEPLVRQYSAYRPFPDVAVDGTLGLTENLADLGGLVAAFDAYRRRLGNRADDKDYVRQQDREFFLGFARSWRAKYRDDAMKAQAASDHAPENYRVSTVRNIDAWYEAFDVKPGQRLFLEPAARVRIW